MVTRNRNGPDGKTMQLPTDDNSYGYAYNMAWHQTKKPPFSESRHETVARKSLMVLNDS